MKKNEVNKKGTHELEEFLRFERLLSDLSATFVGLPSEKVDKEIENEIRKLVEFLGADRSTLMQFLEGEPGTKLTHSWAVPGVGLYPSSVCSRASDYWPWMISQIKLGNTVRFSNLDELPLEAKIDKQLWASTGMKSHISIPVTVGKNVLGILSFGCLRAHRVWNDIVIERLRIVGSVFANALYRKQMEEKLRKAEVRYRTVADLTYNWEYWIGPKGSFYYISPSCERLSGYTIQEFVKNPSLYMDIIIPEDQEVWDKEYRKARRVLKPGSVEFRILRKDEKIKWIKHVYQPVKGIDGDFFGFRCSNIDITEMREAELKLKSAFLEIKLLKEQVEADYGYLREEINLEHNFEGIVGNSKALKHVLKQVGEVAPTNAIVMILGETGTGKELIARAIHNLSSRRERPMVKVNCAALSPNLIESELFGHEKGAFTGAGNRRIGRFELADCATLFLDEISELPLEVQSKLLRVLQEGEFERLGSSDTIQVNVRVIAASNRNLEEEVSKGRFRQDLWYRINVFPIKIPPLRDRKEDIALMANWFVNSFSRKMGKPIKVIPRNVLKQLEQYYWPGNIRELEHIIERAIITTHVSTLQLADELKMPDAVLSPTESLQEHLGRIEKEKITNTLKKLHWKIDGPRGAAIAMGLPPSTLRDRIKRLGIRRS